MHMLWRVVREVKNLEEGCWTLDEKCPSLGALLNGDITLDISMCLLFEGVLYLCRPTCFL